MTSEPTPDLAAEQFGFKAEIRQLLNILVHSLYQDRDIFLRELISNASDALTRLHFESLTNSDIVDPGAELAIWLETEEDGDTSRLIVKDTGIGMTREELIENLGTIAQSGAREFLNTIDQDGLPDGEELKDIIGQFGVGFYSVFMVADEVRVISRSFRPEAEAAMWISDGGDSFRVEPADKSDRGTEVHITLKADAAEMAQGWKLKNIVKKHSDFVNYPIYLDEEQINQQQSLWRQSPQDVEQDAYERFYQQLTMDFQPPTAVIHFRSDVPVDVRALLFVPASREPSPLSPRRDPGLKLYSNNVLIQEFCTDLLPNWLGFVDGVVDSEDLPLNVSRETVQNNRLMRQLGKIIRSRVIRRLKELADDAPDNYNDFWRKFSRAFKEGLATDPTAREDILPLLRFHSSNDTDDLTSLDAYVDRMAEDQEKIFYVLADDLASARRSPHLDPFKARGLEVLFYVDPLDAFIVPALDQYRDKSFQNIDDAGLELPELEAEAADSAVADLDEADFNRLVGKFVTILGDRVTEVRQSRLLQDSPVRLVSPEGATHREMERVYRYVDEQYEIPKRILEVNRRHPLIANLARIVTANPADPLIPISVEQLYGSALIQEGLHPNPAALLPTIQSLLETAVANAAPPSAEVITAVTSATASEEEE